MNTAEFLSRLDEISILRHKIIDSIDLSELYLSINPTQVQVLMAILKTPENNMTVLSRQVGLEKSSLTRAMDSLLSEGFVTRLYSPRDRRVISCALTEKGLATAKELDKIMCAHCDKLLGYLSVSEQDELEACLVKALQLLGGTEQTLNKKR
jgi:DNA-binding MarR family transcriptional regulator